MKELITRGQADLFLLVGPLVVAIAGFGHGALRRKPGSIAFGVAAVLVAILWRVFNAIAGRLGIDTVANLAVNAALFGAVGLAGGIALARWVPYPADLDPDTEPPDDEPEAEPTT